MAGFCLLQLSGQPTLAQSSGANPPGLTRLDIPLEHDTSPPLRHIVPGHEPGPKHEVYHFRLPSKGASAVADPVVQSSAGPLQSTTAGNNFDGVGLGAYGFVPNAAPPDPNGAVGATQYVQWVNESFAVFDKKTGALLYGPATGNTLWSGYSGANGACAKNNDGDPIVQYDKAANRWIMTQFSVTGGPPYFQCIAVSTTSDATGSWNRYSIQLNNFPDYPKLGVWPDGYYISFTMFNGNQFAGAQVWALDRNSMLQGLPAGGQGFQLSAAYGGLLPSDLDGGTAPPAGSPNFFLNFGSNSLNFWRFHVDWPNSVNTTLTGPMNLPVAAFTEACGGGTCIPQPGTSQQLDSLGDRLMYRLAYRNFGGHEALVVNHSVTAGSSVGPRWYELRNQSGQTLATAAPVVYQQGTFAPDSNYRWMGSIAMDKAGNIALGYSVSSGSMYPSIYYTGRAPGDAPGTMGSETLIVAGGGSQLRTLNRWGDYTAMAIDPVDDCTFWYTNEYLLSSGTFNWSTRIASFKFSSCGTPDFTLSASPASSTVTAGGTGGYNVTVGSIGNFSGSVTLAASGLPAGANASFATNPVPGGSGSSQMNVSTTAGVTPAGSYTLAITGTSGTLSHQVTVTLAVNSAGDFSLSASPASQSLTQGGGTTYTVSAAGSGGFLGAVSLAVSGLPSGAAASFNPASLSLSGSTPASSALSLSTSSSTPAGSYPLTVTGTSGTLSHSSTVTLVVNAAPKPDFTISAAPSSLSIARGLSNSYSVTVTAVNAFTGTVNFSVSGLPGRTSASFNPTSVTGSGSSTMTVTVGRKAATGAYTLTIKGTSGSLLHSTTVTLTIK